MSFGPYGRRLVSFAESVHRDAGVEPTEDQAMDMAAAAGGVFVNRILMTAAVENEVDEFIAYWRRLSQFDSRPSRELVAAYDDIHNKFIDTLANANWERSGLKRGLPVALAHDRAEEFAEEQFTAALASLKPTWTTDIRNEYGTTGSAPPESLAGGAPGQEPATPGGGCMMMSLGALLAVRAAVGRSRH